MDGESACCEVEGLKWWWVVVVFGRRLAGARSQKIQGQSGRRKKQGDGEQHQYQSHGGAQHYRHSTVECDGKPWTVIESKIRRGGSRRGKRERQTSKHDMAEDWPCLHGDSTTGYNGDGDYWVTVLLLQLHRHGGKRIALDSSSSTVRRRAPSPAACRVYTSILLRIQTRRGPRAAGSTELHPSECQPV